MLPAGSSSAGPSLGRLIQLLCLLWLAGVALRMTILAMPPVIPLVHAELHMSETQVGLLVGLPLALFALAAVPGSLLVARIGAKRAVVLGMTIAGIASGARGAAFDIWTLYAAVIATGFGIAITQPAMPALVRQWLPDRIGLGTVGYTSGMLIGATFSSVLTIPFILPWTGGSWRLDLLFWAVPAVLIVPLFALFSPKSTTPLTLEKTFGARWWPDWKNPLIWFLGLTLGGNNSSFFSTNAFLGDYLASLGKADQLGSALAWLNGAQIIAPVLLIVMAKQAERRAWPYLIFGPALLASFLAMIFVPTDLGITIAAAFVGFTTAMTFPTVLALPPLLVAPADVPRTAAGMFTISYTTAIIIPTISGALWDATGQAWTAFVPLCVCAVALTVFGALVTQWRSASETSAAE
jgi:CP family cyanate transporter-like MFS transporter